MSEMSVSEREQLHWLLAKAHDNLEFEEEELSDFDKAEKEAKLIDVATRQLKAYSLTGMRKDTIIDNCRTLKETFASLTAQRYKLPGEDLKKAKEYLEFAKWFVENNQADPVAKDVSGACLFIQKYFEVLGLETEYPAKYEPGQYRRYYEAKEEEELLHTPYDKISKLDVVSKMKAHSRRAARLIRQIEKVPEAEKMPEDFNLLVLERLSKALRDLSELRKQKQEELSNSGLYGVGPEKYFDWMDQQRKQQALAKEPESEADKRYRITKEASKRIRAQLAREGKITAIEE